MICLLFMLVGEIWPHKNDTETTSWGFWLHLMEYGATFGDLIEMYFEDEIEWVLSGIEFRVQILSFCLFELIKPYFLWNFNIRLDFFLLKIKQKMQRILHHT